MAHNKDRVVIWSGEYAAYWRPGGAGYVSDLRDAGVFLRKEAIALTSHLGPEKQVELRLAPVAPDIKKMLQEYATAVVHGNGQSVQNTFDTIVKAFHVMAAERAMAQDLCTARTKLWVDTAAQLHDAENKLLNPGGRLQEALEEVLRLRAALTAIGNRAHEALGE